jgi:hypothetical protein
VEGVNVSVDSFLCLFMPFVLGSEEETPAVKVPHKAKAVPAKATPVPAKPQTSSEEDSSSEDDTPRKYNRLLLPL